MRRAVPAMIFALLTPLARAEACPELDAGFIRHMQALLDLRAGRSHIPEIERAATALRDGDRQEAIRLLVEASRLPTDERLLTMQPPPVAGYVQDVWGAGEDAYILNGCVKTR